MLRLFCATEKGHPPAVWRSHRSTPTENNPPEPSLLGRRRVMPKLGGGVKPRQSRQGNLGGQPPPAPAVRRPERQQGGRRRCASLHVGPPGPGGFCAGTQGALSPSCPRGAPPPRQRKTRERRWRWLMPNAAGDRPRSSGASGEIADIRGGHSSRRALGQNQIPANLCVSPESMNGQGIFALRAVENPPMFLQGGDGWAISNSRTPFHPNRWFLRQVWEDRRPIGGGLGGPADPPGKKKNWTQMTDQSKGAAGPHGFKGASSLGKPRGPHLRAGPH